MLNKLFDVLDKKLCGDEYVPASETDKEWIVKLLKENIKWYRDVANDLESLITDDVVTKATKANGQRFMRLLQYYGHNGADKLHNAKPKKTEEK